MRYAILGGGKRLQAVPGGRDGARFRRRRATGPRRVGAAIECLHGYSLIHDDLPAMDDDDLRRGRPTVHTRLRRGDGDPRRRRAADAGVRDPRRAGHGGRRRSPRRAVRGSRARRSGLAGMVGGQMLDLAAERAAEPLDGAAIAELQAMKTGALLSFSVEAGGLIAGAPAAARAALRALRRGARRGVPDRRRPARRRGRRGDAGQAASARTPAATRRPSSPRSGWRARARGATRWSPRR